MHKWGSHKALYCTGITDSNTDLFPDVLVREQLIKSMHVPCSFSVSLGNQLFFFFFFSCIIIIVVEQLQPLYLHSGVQDVQGLSCAVCCGSEAPEDCESHSKGQFLPQIVYSLFKQDRQKVKEQSRFLLLLCCCFFFFLPTVGEM